MICPHCGNPMIRKINGRVIWHCKTCGHEEATPDLAPPYWDSKEAYERTLVSG